MGKSSEELKKSLRVIFVGEEGVDAGGLQKEFFQLLIRNLFDVRYGTDLTSWPGGFRSSGCVSFFD